MVAKIPGIENWLTFLIVLQFTGKVNGKDQFLNCSQHDKFLDIHYFCKNFVDTEFKVVRTLKAGELPIPQNDLVNVNELTISEAFISEIEVGAFRGLNNLTYLDLIGNYIEKLDLKVFEDLPHLNFLQLGVNKFKEFPKDAEFPKMNLTNLDLSYCKIKSIPVNLFKNLENLAYLDIRENQLRAIDWKVFQNLKKLKDVYWRKNPLYCDCHFKFVLDFFDKRNVKWVHPVLDSFHNHTPKCNASVNPTLVGIPWHKIDRKLLTCPPEVTLLSKSQVNKQERNGNILLKCEYSSYPEPNVTWTMNGQPFSLKAVTETEVLESVEEFPEFNYKFRNILTVVPALLSDGGIYFTCNLQNVAGSVQKTIFVESRTTPAIQSPPKDYISESNSNFEIGIKICTVLITLIAIAVGAFIVVRYWRKVRSNSASEIETKVTFGADEGEISSVTRIIIPGADTL